MIRELSQRLRGFSPNWHERVMRDGFGAWVGPLIVRIGSKMPRWLPRLAKVWSDIQAIPQPSQYNQRTNKHVDLGDLLPEPAANNAGRSILLLHNSYYHFLYLATALRRRGWDAILVSNYPPEHYARDLFHGEDVNLYTADAEEYQTRLDALCDLVPSRFRMVHFAGIHHMSVYPEHFDWKESVGRVPWDFLEFRNRGAKIGYTISGCHDGIRQSVYKKHKDVCSKCVWELRSDVCADKRNAAWGRKLSTMCDLAAVEADFGHEWRNKPFAYREPLTVALDPDLWHPDLEVPDRWRLRRAEGELIVVHGFANSDTRQVNGRDIKGSGAIISAIERLQAEGFKVRLEFLTNIPSRDMRFLQVQADIVVDQLNLGRYGAQAREGLMLGKPTVCHIDPREPEGVSRLTCWDECPLVDATEETIYEVLRRLLSSPEERQRIGRASRAYALKWHAADSAAKRFERVYDRILAGLPVNVSEAEIHGEQ